MNQNILLTENNKMETLFLPIAVEMAQNVVVLGFSNHNPSNILMRALTSIETCDKILPNLLAKQ
jgi:hypothetical protein